ncbi:MULTISPECIES: bifunctional diguanylate cyclase/phosphodiesterase [Gammaproteobacteria]|uniref:putative bifunctional diguanylate cyclase/phosphodiesterase n=1 Tax=Gammaproteobacteria TaxID=1236 RepID=UPI000DD0A751|nr:MULTISPECIES: EAL domain-containing protein [Gammaproteobacteria]RTE86296.1 EAL domain-containing protein [Aliidiomarina sp. B3213]TCZ91647.1 EAL domain-containing protein [Lysobacter sp. N42]
MRNYLRTHPSPAGATYYTVVMAGVLIGLVGIGLEYRFGNDQPIMSVLSLTASIIALISGIALYIVMRGSSVIRVALGTFIALMSMYSITRSVILEDAIIGDIGPIGSSAHWPLAAPYLIFGLLIAVGVRSDWRKQLWQYGGAAMIIWGIILSLFSWFQLTYTWVAPHPMVADIASRFVILIGIAVWFGGEHGIKLNRLPSTRGLIVGFLGVLLPTMVWFSLSVKESRAVVYSGMELVEEVATRREQTSWRNVNLIIRLVSSWSSVSDSELVDYQEQDILRLLNDEPQILSIMVFDQNWNVLVEKSSDRSAYSHYITATDFEPFEDVRRWINHSPESRSVTVPMHSIEETATPVILFRQPMYRNEQLYGYVVAVYDFAKLVNPSTIELNSEFKTSASIGPYLLSSRGDFTEILLSNDGHRHSLFLYQQTMNLPYMPETELSVYLDDTSELRTTSNIQAFVLVSGFLVAIFLVISLENSKILRRQRKQLKLQATEDELTGLANRAVLESHLEVLCERYRFKGDGIAVLFVDLDGFKPINDSLGLEVGDALLKETSARLKSLSPNHVLVARFGGDEFVMVVRRNTEQRKLNKLIQDILASLAQPFDIDGNKIYLTASIGITTTDETPPSPRLLIQHADMAMFQAKRRGRNQSQLFSRTMVEKFHEAVSLRNKLQQALDNKELSLHYQPVMSAVSREVIGVEALLRWEIAPGKFISPADFIPLAEDSGQIIPISEWVLEQATQDALALQEYGDIILSVNLSAVQFQRANFIDSLKTALAKNNYPSEKLRLELTESILVEDQREAINILNRIRELGMSVSIDDFGTGFSSLSYLKNLPADQLKIDRSFIADIVSENSDGAITRGIIAMASQLGMHIVAEGVETETQASFLEKAGVNAMQGFYFAKPMPIENAKEFIAKHTSQEK